MCPLASDAFARLLRSYPKPIPAGEHAIDAILNDLPRHAHSLQHSHWRRTWPLLLHVLRDIDVCNRPGDQFDPEPDPSLFLDEHFGELIAE